MTNRRPMLLIALFVCNSSCTLYPYYPLSPTVKLKPANVSDIEIVPIRSAGSTANGAPNAAGTYNGGWDASNNGAYTGQWSYTATSVESLPRPPINNSGTLICGEASSSHSSAINPTRECEVQKAINYANQANDQYLKAQSQHADMPGLGALILLPAAGSAAALAIEGVGTAAVTGLGVGSATLLGLGTFLHTTARETVYNTGALGIQCMLENMEPYTRINSDDLASLTQTIDSGRFFTADDDVDASTLDLTNAKIRLALQISHVEALGLQNNCQRLPRVMKLASLLLKAAKAADTSADKTIQVGNEFARTALAAPITIVNTTNHINAALNGALISTEPSLSALANNIKSVIPDKAQSLAGLAAAKTAAADAQTKTADASSGGPGTSKKATTAKDNSGQLHDFALLGSNIQFKSAGDTVTAYKLTQTPAGTGSVSKQPVDVDEADNLTAPSLTPKEFIELVQLERSIYIVSELTNRVLRIIGAYTGKVDNSKCPILAKKAGTPPAMKLDPSGDIPVEAGSHAAIAITDATDPYIRPLFSQNVCTAVTATLKANEIDVAATPVTTPGFYPFFAGDGPTGRIVDVMVTPKPTGDNTDEVQECKNPHDAGYVPKPTRQGHQIKYSCPPAFVLMPQPVGQSSP